MYYNINKSYQSTVSAIQNWCSFGYYDNNRYKDKSKKRAFKGETKKIDLIVKNQQK